MKPLHLALGLFAPVVFACSASTGVPGDDHHGPGEKAKWEEAFIEKDQGKADGSGCSGVQLPDQGTFGKRVALTFDDGPSPETTPQVLDILAEYGIKATFFINGNKVNSNAARQVLQRIIGEGHILANHSQAHDDFRDITPAERDTAVRLTNEVIASVGVTPVYFRFPYGAATCSSIAMVEGYDLTVTGWHVDSGDWCYKNHDGYCTYDDFEHIPNGFRHDMVGFTLSQIRARQGGIVLFHDIHQFTVNNLETIITRLVSEGFSFTNIDDTVTFPRLNGITPPFIGDACKDVDDCGFIGGVCQLYPLAGGKTGGFCSSSCQGTCPDAPGEAPTFCTSLDGGATGRCVSKAHIRNHDCADILGTSKQTRPRFIGTSNAAPASADVCVPN